MDKRTTGIIATLAATLFCGIPGLIVFCITLIIAFFVPLQSAGGGINGNVGPVSAIVAGLGIMCLGLILIAIPVIVAIVTLRTKTEEGLPEIEPEVEDEPSPELEEAAQSALEVEKEPEVEEKSQPEGIDEVEAESGDEGDIDEELPDPLG